MKRMNFADIGAEKNVRNQYGEERRTTQEVRRLKMKIRTEWNGIEYNKLIL